MDMIAYERISKKKSLDIRVFLCEKKFCSITKLLWNRYIYIWVTESICEYLLERVWHF